MPANKSQINFTHLPFPYVECALLALLNWHMFDDFGYRVLRAQFPVPSLC